MGIKVIVPTTGSERFRAYRWVEAMGYEVHYVCDNEFQALDVMEKTRKQTPQVHVTNFSREQFGQSIVALTRDWAMRTIVDPGEWCIWVDDNVSGLTALPREFVKDRIDFDLDDEPAMGWREGFETPAESPRALLDGLIQSCEDANTIFGGMAIETNYFFRKLRWQWWGYVRTQCAVYKNDTSSWLAWYGMMLEDFVKSVDVVCRYGRIVIDRSMKPIKPSFEAGGIGSFDERLPNLRHDSAMLMEKYPGLLKQVKPDVDYQLTFAKRSQASIDRWREANGYLTT